ncbi:MAG: hypothetical protein FWE88_02620 [Phycisphaerae bacterium]|nr:hypothetical protein [Phycisphaerae bacterium]
MKHCLLRLLLPLLIVASGPALAGGGGENVLLVVNADSFSSMTLANEYMRLRQVPVGNVVYLHLGDLRDQSAVDVNTFRERILRPALAAIADRKLTPQIDYIVYSSDVHYAVNTKSDVTPALQTWLDEQRKQHNGDIFATTAATTGLTFLHHSVLAKNADPRQSGYLGLTVNRYARSVSKVNVNAVALQRHLDTVRQQLKDKQHGKAQEAMAELLRALPNNPEILYTHACLLAGQGKTDDAIAALQQAVDRGFNQADRANDDALLASLRGRKEFTQLLIKMPAAKAPAGDESLHPQPALAFRSALRWNDKGQPAPTGESYMLSTMLGWTSGRGTSIRQTLDGLRRSAASDGTNPKGTFYFMVNDNVRSTTRQWAFASAAARLRELGHSAELANGVLPKNRKDIVGLMAGSEKFDVAASGSRILPGAICEHLTSFGGMLFDGAGQTPCTEFLRHGAAGTSGTVTEPYALQAKFPSPFVHVHYARGCSLAEAFYQSVTGPYQLIMLGDPLCQPWASIPKVNFVGVSDGETVKGILAIAPGAGNATDKIAQWLLFVNGRQATTCAPGGKLRLDTTTLPDGPLELRIVCVREGPIMTQGRAIITVNVANGAAVDVDAKLAASRIAFGQSTTLAASAKGASKIIVTCNGREIGAIDGEAGEITIDSTRLGMGKLRIACEAVLSGKPSRRMTLPPVELQVDEPAVAGGVSDAVAKRLSITTTPNNPSPLPQGFAITLGEETMPTAPNMRHPEWLAASGATTDKPFTLHGYVKVGESDLHQLQIFFDGELTVEVNGQTVAAQHSARGWRHFPMTLKAGWHELNITATATVSMPAMDLYFGARGTPRLTTERIFRLPG